MEILHNGVRIERVYKTRDGCEFSSLELAREYIEQMETAASRDTERFGKAWPIRSAERPKEINIDIGFLGIAIFGIGVLLGYFI